MRTISHLSILSWICCTAAAAKRPLYPHHERRGLPSLPLRSHESWSLSRRRHNAFVPIAIPRGGSNDDDVGDSEESSSDDEHERDWLPQTSLQRSISSLSSVFTQTIYPCAASFLVKVRRSCIAGWEAACEKDSDAHSRVDEDCDDDDGTDLPKLQSFLGKAGHVLHEMYRAALLEDEENAHAAADYANLNMAFDLEGNRKRRNATKSPSGRKRHRKRTKKVHGHHKRKATATAIVCNGGGIDHTDTTHQEPAYNQQRDILYLAQKYGVSDTSQIHHSSVFTSTHTSFNEILQKSNADARFLICYIASESSPQNKILIPSFLDAQFNKVCKRKPLGKKNLQDSGSFYVWICCTDKAAGEEAKKRLKIKPLSSGSSATSSNKQKKKTTPPILTILHPASTVDSSNRLKVSPRILVQHHCNPPPSSVDTLSAWVTSVRKRHLREYAKLQHDRKEVLLMKERSEGYMRSIQEDAVREKKEEEELQRKREEEERIQRRREEMERRRAELLESLPEEPENGEGVITVALRYQSVPPNAAASTQRRFSKNDTMNDVFNWIDAMHALERETIVLSTMNGSRTFRFVEDKVEKDDREEEELEEIDDDDDDDAKVKGENMTLEEAGLGRMTALRVTKISTEDSAVSESSEN
ncbi:hypothetical protein HJC23_009439 [Cyclotella cryptica]|uniref:UBX domain-containing protein n=1 Tax=Cyclotella cryptica TaxID=29204 RepID=A0ABD3Q304_9STRA|eukprot:CCRYP_009536-RA/>CCRYP_009536-RA protein AED:0.09 eAED:0.09 QI:0/-1/0/1/-1/1/1/0/641